MKKQASKAIFVLVVASFCVYALVLAALLFLGTRGHWSGMPLSEYIRHSVNFVPFKTIAGYVSALLHGTMNADIPIKNLAGNLLMFAPLGFYLPYFSKKPMGLLKCLGFAAAIIVGLEALQLFTRMGSFDIDDLLLNLLGVLVGFVVCRHTLLKWLRGEKVNFGR